MKKIIALLAMVVLLTSFVGKNELTWMAIGDSITYLDDKPELTKNRITKGYMTRVVEKLPNIHFKNIGMSGWTASSIADNIDRLGIEKADIYTVFLGTNDWWTGLPLGTINDYQNNTGNKTAYGAYRTIIDKIRSLNPDAKIILMTPLQRTDFADVNGKTTIHGCYKEHNGCLLSQYADAIIAVAKLEHLEVVDLYYKSGITPQNAVKYKRLKDPKTGEYKKYHYPEYTSIPFNSETDEYPYPTDAINMTYDGLHPSDKGHAKIAGMLIKVLKRN